MFFEDLLALHVGSFSFLVRKVRFSSQKSVQELLVFVVNPLERFFPLSNIQTCESSRLLPGGVTDRGVVVVVHYVANFA